MLSHMVGETHWRTRSSSSRRSLAPGIALSPLQLALPASGIIAPSDAMPAAANPLAWYKRSRVPSPRSSPENRGCLKAPSAIAISLGPLHSEGRNVPEIGCQHPWTAILTRVHATGRTART